jgi:signal transduction histidine kinase
LIAGESLGLQAHSGNIYRENFTAMGACYMTLGATEGGAAPPNAKILIQYSAQLSELGQVSAEMAHDVKNPLHAMVVRLAFLKERLASPPADIARSLDGLEADLNRVAAAIDRFMEVFYPPDVVRMPVDVHALLRDITALLQAEWRSKGVILTAQLDSKPPQIRGDEQMLRHALMHLIVNACQAMPNGGRITVATETETGECLKVTISDSGGGIPQEAVERIFNMYCSAKPEGAVIGLALVRRVVDLHHGSIEILSTVGQGTNVIVRLPIHPGS